MDRRAVRGAFGNRLAKTFRVAPYEKTPNLDPYLSVWVRRRTRVAFFAEERYREAIEHLCRFKRAAPDFIKSPRGRVACPFESLFGICLALDEDVKIKESNS